LGFFGGLALGILVGNIGSRLAESDAWAYVGMAIPVVGFIMGGWFALRSVPTTIKTRAAALDHAAMIKKYRTKTFGESSADIEFRNDGFAELFVIANPLFAESDRGIDRVGISV
jgi:hypothetical protein